MAEEPSWEDIFNPNPTPREPAAPNPAPLVEPAQAYPPTQAYPPQPPAQQQPPQQAAQPAPEEDPFAALFGTAEPAQPVQAQPVQPQPAQPQQVYPPVPEQQAAPSQPEPAQPAAPQQQAFPAAQAYPPTQAYPTPEAQFAQEFPLRATPPAAAPAEIDPLAGLFGSARPEATPATPPPSEYTAPAPFPTTATARFTPREDDDPFAALFGTSAAPAAEAVARTSGEDGNAPLSRREAREGEGRRRTAENDVVGAGGGRGGRDGGSGAGSGGSGPGGKPKKKRSLLWLKITLPIVLVLALVGGAAGYGWFNYNEQVRALLGIPLPTDYTGAGNGTEVIVTIQSGDIGEDIAHTLHDKGVTLTFKAFYDLLLAQKEQPNFQPGNFRLQEHMSAQAALDALLNPDNKVVDKLLITEGTVLPKALEIISETTNIPLADLQAASKDLASFGLPAEAVSLEGYLFPATYQLDTGVSAHDVLQLLVNTMFEHLDSAGVAPADRNRVLTMAALIQREAGPSKDDFYKISRVFANRLDQGINFESDATVAYGTGRLDTVFTTDSERADPNNPYNTYVHPGMPYGPIGLPGDLAIDAALHPVDGPWLFFVPINLKTGETVFSETVDEHDAAVQQLQEWCAASAENESYCGE
ncbi:hypothetical protein BH11ACT4_BH11ACT4_03740 [soil metagenome]